MKKFVLFALALLVLSPASFAVTWKLVNVSIVVRTPNQATGGIQSTVLTNRKYIDRAMLVTNAPRSDHFIGIRTDTLVVAVVQRSTKTMVAQLVIPSPLVSTRNAAGTVGFATAPAAIQTLNAAIGGFMHDAFRATVNGKVTTITRQVMGGAGDLTLKGTIRTTGRTIEL